VKSFRAGPLLVRAVGGDDRDGGGAGPAVLLCHGFGAPGDDLVSLHRAVHAPPHTRWFFPEAPLDADVGPGSRAWWPIDMMEIQLAMMRGEQRRMADTLPEGMEAARDQLAGCIDALIEHHGVEPTRLLIGGFSQGAMITTELTLFGERRFAGLAVLSGTLLCRERWATRSDRLADLSIVQSHGRSDPILPFSQAEALRDLFVAGGAKHQFVPFNGQHAIPAQALAGFESLITDTLGQAE
jgi:phospholipase/carboxylesterase